MPDARPFTTTDIALANRNKGMPLDLLRHDITPVGAHYTLTHFDIPFIDPNSYRLSIGGLVDAPLSLSLDDLQSIASTTLPVTLECAGNGRTSLDPRPVNMPWGVEAIGTAEWTGVPLRHVIDRAALRPDALELVFSAPDEGRQHGIDHAYQRSLAIADATRPEVLLAWAMNGRPLEPQHGAPLRLIVPGWYGMASVKWVTNITAVAEPFRGPQQALSYVIKTHPADAGEPVRRIRVRAVMTPPGRPEFPSLERFAKAGPILLFGRAWSGESAVERVVVGVDGTWTEAELSPSVGPFAWRSWTFDWQATPGSHELSCRATDAMGRSQPLEPAWNEGGYANNMVQTVRLYVE
jgi:DMSO/TMAO reductase YedYZ molybdopterin-dependent catalytic subunit